MTSTPEATWDNPFPTPVTNKTTYLAGFQYKDNCLEFFPHAEGYVKYQYSENSYSYVFNYTDHLGNVRVSYSDIDKNGLLGSEHIQECPKQIGPTPPPCQDLYVSAILEESHYYPFGLKHEGYNSNNQQSNYNYKYNGKELQTELGLNLYDYGARNYDPSLGRWMNMDPLAERYSSMTPYNYTLNNPLFFIDPDGMRVRNGDEERRKVAEENNKEWQESLALKAEYLGISVNASRSKWKKAAIAKEGKIEWKRTQNVRKGASNASDELSKYTKASAKSEEKINELKTEAPLLFEKMDALSTDIFISSKDYIPNNDGQNNTDFDSTDPENVSLRSKLMPNSKYIPNSIEIVISNNPSGGRTTLEVMKHEMGHADYAIEFTQLYYNWLKTEGLINNNHDGHRNNDPSGKRAVEFGPKKFKNQ